MDRVFQKLTLNTPGQCYKYGWSTVWFWHYVIHGWVLEAESRAVKKSKHFFWL